MKPQYKTNDWSDDEHWKGRYELRTGGYHRWFRCFNEVKQNRHAELDGYKIRRKRNTIPTVNDDLSHSQMYGRDWKRFTKRHHQWKDYK